jgi:Ca2+-binding RTX toxin-like protein
VDLSAAPLPPTNLVLGTGTYGVTFYPDNLLSANDVIGGTGSADWIQGRGGNDSITGGAGDDTLDGGGQAYSYLVNSDTLVGGAGDDVYIVRNYTTGTGDQVVESASNGTDTVVLANGGIYVMPDNVENLEVAPAWLIGTGYNTSYGYVTGNARDNIIRASSGAYSYANDSFSGGEGNDRLFGLAGNDTLNGGTGNDIMSGGDGDDTYYVDAAGDRVYENTVVAYDIPNYLDGDTVVTTISYTLGAYLENLTLDGVANLNGAGNTLNNHIIGNNGNNTINGNDGVDTLSYQTATTKVTAALSTGTATGGGGTDTINNIENLIGGTVGDNLKGSTAANRLDGNTGADTLTGLSGDDTYVVDNAADSLVEGSGNGTDTVESLVSWTLANNFENLTLTANYTSINGTGNNADNLIIGSNGTNVLLGQDGDDTIWGAPQYVYGYGDSIDGGAGADELNGSYSNDTILGGTEVDILRGDSGNDTLDGGGAGDALHGGNDADTLNGGAGADTMDGGYGSDTFYVDNVGDVVMDTMLDEYAPNNIYYINTVISSVNYALPFAIDNLVLTGSAARGAGNYLDNVITVNASSVNNVLNGARGIDTLSYAEAGAGVTVSLALSGGQATGGSGTDSIRNFENLTGSDFADTLIGTAGNNVIDGGAGNDVLKGGKGDDTYLVDSAADAITEQAGNGIDTVNATVGGVTLGAEVENLLLLGIGTAGTGNTLANTITGNYTNNLLTGLGGNDTIDGGLGTDTLDGGAGNDTYKLNNITDQVLDSGGVELVILSTEGFWGASYLMPDGIENLQFDMPSYYYGGYYANATGNALANSMRGGNGTNTLSGEGGADTISGGGGLDTLTGGAGADVFLFDTPLGAIDSASYNTALHGIDTITDFVHGTDKIALDDDIFAALPTAAAGALTAANLKVGIQAGTADQRIVYDSSTGALYYDPDGNGAQAQIQFAQLSTGLTLTAADFQIV